MFYRLPSKRLPFGAVLFACSVFILAGCSSDDDGSSADEPDTQNPSDGDAGSDTGTGGEGGDTDSSMNTTFALVSGATPTFDAGQIESLSIGDSIASAGTYPATLSDISVATDGTDVYQIGKFGIDSITRFTTSDFATPIYQYSVLQNEASPNTFDMVFASENKAYVLQYGGTSILVVDPTAATEADFITGNIDISAYDDDAPNAASAVVADGKLFVLMQRLSAFTPDKPGYVAVFDTATDMELDTGMGADGLAGIALTTTNPQGLQYVEELSEIVVTGRGNIFGNASVEGDPYQGGLETIDTDSYALDFLLDDGDQDSNNGFFAASHVVSQDKGYIIGNASWQTSTLFAYNPLTGMLNPTPVAGLENMDLTTLATGPSGRLWVGVGGTTPGFVLIDPADDSISVDKVPTQFVPNRVVFVTSSN